MGRDCLWDSEEQDWEWTAQLICSSFWYGTRLPLGHRGAKHRLDSSAQLCCSWLSQRQSCPIQKQGAQIFKLCSSFSVLLLAVPEASRPIPKRGESVPPGPSFARSGCPDAADYEPLNYLVTTLFRELHRVCLIHYDFLVYNFLHTLVHWSKSTGITFNKVREI